MYTQINSAKGEKKAASMPETNAECESNSDFFPIDLEEMFDTSI